MWWNAFRGGWWRRCGRANDDEENYQKYPKTKNVRILLVLVPPCTYLTGDCNFLASVACVYPQQTPTLADEMGGPSSILVLKCGYLWDDSPESDRYSEESLLV